MDIEGDYALTDIRYRGKNSVKKNKLNNNASKKKVSIVANDDEKVVKVDVAKCSDKKVVNIELKGAGCSGGSVKGEKEKLSAESGDVVECGASGEVEMEGKEKGGESVRTSGGGGSVGAKCRSVGQMSRETLQNLRRHLGDGRGESFVVMLCLIVIL